MNKLAFLLVISFCFVACTASNLSKTGLQKIEFGSGGGFAGRYQTYVLDCTKNEVVNSDGTMIKKLTKSEIKEVTGILKGTDFSSVTLNYPHNMSYFIHFQGKYTNKITWGDPMHPAPDSVKKLYDTLMKFIKQ